jgi:hypothetical protein
MPPHQRRISLGTASMLRNYVWKSAVYVVSPLDVIAIGRIPQSREQRKLQMIVRIDEARAGAGTR